MDALLARMRAAVDGPDTETAHIQADAVLCDLVEYLVVQHEVWGRKDVADQAREALTDYRQRTKWYA
jgi:hypothetical protein